MLLLCTLILTSIFLVFTTLTLLTRAARRRAAARSNLQLHTDFAIEELHSLLLQGKLTRDEFERARASVLSRRRPTPTDENPRPKGFEVLEPRDHI
jgi:hypothetical protein